MCPDFYLAGQYGIVRIKSKCSLFSDFNRKERPSGPTVLHVPRVKESFLDGFFLCSELNEPHIVHSFRHVRVFVVVLKVLIYIMLCCRFVYETEHFNGVGELLEILGR